MALFRKDNDNSSRAVDIIKGIKPSKQDPSAPTTPEPQNPAAAVEPQVPPVEPQNPAAAVEPQVPPVEPQNPAAAVEPQNPEPIDPKNIDPQNPVEPAAQPEPQHPADSHKEPVTPTAPTITEQAVLDYLSEKLNRKVEKLGDLTNQEQKVLDPEVQQLLDWKEKTGLSLSKFSEYNRDFSKMSDLEVAREILSQQYSNLTPEELEYVMKEYTFNEDEDEQSVKIAKSVKLKQFAVNGRKELEKNRLNLIPSGGQVLTEELQKDLDLAKQVRENQKTAELTQQNYVKNLEKAALSLGAINLQLADNLDLKYDIAEGDRRNLPKMVQEMPHWYNQDGSVNHQAIVRDALIIKEFPNMIKKAYEQGVSSGMESKIKKDKNINLDPGHKPTSNDDGRKKGNIDQVVDNIAGGPKNKKMRFGAPKN